jgi:hypothetical protein
MTFSVVINTLTSYATSTSLRGRLGILKYVSTLCLYRGTLSLKPHISRIRPSTTSPTISRFLEQADAQKLQPCTKEKMQVRQDFNKMAPHARKAYTDTVKCLMKQSLRLNSAQHPGAISRFFDYSAIRINGAKTVHLNGDLFTWHRMFV